MEQSSPKNDITARALQTPWRLLALLMAMTAIGPTSLNIIVPALPKLTSIFAADPDTIQLAVSLFLVGLAAAQLVIGPLSDRFGRRPVALAGLALTGIGSLVAIVTPNATTFILARVLQAVGAATGIVIGRAVIRDLFDRERSASMMGLVATAMVVAPMVSPLIGGILEIAFGWRSIFVFLATVALTVLAWAAATLPETRGRHPSHEAGGFLADLRRLVRSRLFHGYVLCATFGSCTFFAFLGGGAHVVVTMMGRSSAEYGFWFAISSIGYMAGNFTASRLSVRAGVDRMILWGLVIEAVGTVTAMTLSFAYQLGPAVVFLPQIITSFGNGVMLPNAIAGAVSVRPESAGTASGILGCVQMAVGAAFVQLGGLVVHGAHTPLPLAALMASVVVAYALAFFLLARPR